MVVQRMLSERPAPPARRSRHPVSPVLASLGIQAVVGLEESGPVPAISPPKQTPGAKLLAVASNALNDWKTAGLQRLAELENVHAQLTGTGRGRRWGATQLNRSLLVALSAQFQSYCRSLHDEAVRVHVSAAIATQRPMLQVLLTQGRKLDTGNPRRSALGSDFVRLGFDFISDLKNEGPATRKRLDKLETMLDFRNAIGHGDEARILAIETGGQIAASKTSYQRYRQAMDGLASTMDRVVADRLSQVLGTDRPW